MSSWNESAKPLGLENTNWSDLSGPNPPYTENVAYPHTVENGKRAGSTSCSKGNAINPSGTMTSNIDDMLTFSAVSHPERRTQWQATADGRESRRTYYAQCRFQLRRRTQSGEAPRVAGTVWARLVAGQLQRPQRRASRR